MKIILSLALVTVSSALADILPHPLSDEFIDYINNQKSTWTAGRNFYLNTSNTHLSGLLGVLDDPVRTLRTKVHVVTEAIEIPDFFDARERWPECADIIGHIRDQSACGSCWAFGAVEAMSDRICIHSNGEKKVLVSAENLMSCCVLNNCGNGCDGGHLEPAWKYWVTEGIVTGGDYGSSDGCQAYQLAPCDHHTESINAIGCSNTVKTPACSKQCDSGTKLNFEEELTFGESSYKIGALEDQIKVEIMKNGPVEASYIVCDDFFAYKSGVYQYVKGTRQGEHAIKIIGWGVEDDTPYWLIANSWNSDWGDNGYFKMLRGSNHLGIESSVIAGIPKL